jgi:hypothetical protein
VEDACKDEIDELLKKTKMKKKQVRNPWDIQPSGVPNETKPMQVSISQ